MRSTSTIARVAYFFPTMILYWLGWLFYTLTGHTFNYSYKSLRFLHVITNGWINNVSNNLISLIRRPSRSSKNNIHSILGEFTDSKINDIVASVQKDGFYIFEEKLSDEIISDILAFGSSTPTRRMTGLGKYAEKEEIVNINTEPQSPRYQFKNERLFENKNLVNIIFDDLFLRISEKYLKCRPIFDYFVMWWSYPFHGKLASEAAQMYHYDMDRIKFIKFFFYVTDVTPDTGPHCFVRGSHESKHDKLRKDGRIEDSEIEKYYDKNDILEICGKKGTVMIVDTIGFHKGKTLTSGSRLLFQILYSDSLFGPKVTKVNIPNHVVTEHKDFLNSNKDVFNQTLNY